MKLVLKTGRIKKKPIQEEVKAPSKVIAPKIPEKVAEYYENDILLMEFFNKEEFLAIWKAKGKVITKEVMASVATAYAFRDALSTVQESLIRHEIDNSAELQDKTMEETIIENLTLRLILIMMRHMHPDGDFELLRNTLYGPSTNSGSRQKIISEKRQDTDVVPWLQKLYEKVVEKKPSDEIQKREPSDTFAVHSTKRQRK